MKREVAPELLDELPPQDLRARGSRNDLLRINAWMGNARTIATALSTAFDGTKPATLIDLGGGDGRFLLQVARRLGPQWQGAMASLVDRQGLVSTDTFCQFKKLGWILELRQADIFDWLGEHSAYPNAIILANLFLHHFSPHQLAQLLRLSARRASLFAAVEPRRSLMGVFFSRLVLLIGCNAVTRHDAPVSVRAGFKGRELSALWTSATATRQEQFDTAGIQIHSGSGGFAAQPNLREHWTFIERSAGFFSHLFLARASTPRAANFSAHAVPALK